MCPPISVSPCPHVPKVVAPQGDTARPPACPLRPPGDCHPPQVPFMVGVVRDTFFLCLGDMARPDCKASGGG